MRAPKPIIIVQGGQWGSEGKGQVAAKLCIERNMDYAVRTGGVNAGHTVHYDGKVYKMQQLPTGWVNSKTKLVVGAGAYINPAILKKEIGEIIKTGRTETNSARLMIDSRAGIHLEKHAERSAKANRHHLIGATGKGCSEAIVDKIQGRGTSRGILFKDWLGGQGWDQGRDSLPFHLCDTELILNEAYDQGEGILLEGTQGQMLDLHLGPYPYTTHKQVGPANWLSETGLSPNLKYEIVMVVRTYPIRVAGNSGPMPGEMDWVELANKMNKRLASLSKEPIIEDWMLALWKTECDMVAASGTLSLPTNNEGDCDYNFHQWSQVMRKDYQEVVSEFHRMVFDRLDRYSFGTTKKLRAVFEFTTVTGKLRRIAEMNIPALRDSIRQVRPNYIVLTFLNYIFPELWGATEIPPLHAAWEYIFNLQQQLAMGIKYVTTGPGLEHVIRVDEV